MHHLRDGPGAHHADAQPRAHELSPLVSLVIQPGIGRVDDHLHRVVGLRDHECVGGPCQAKPVRHDLVQRVTGEVRRHQAHGRLVGGRLLAADAEHRHVPRADRGIGVHRHRAQVDERAGLDDHPAGPHHGQRFGERLREPAAVDDDVGAQPVRGREDRRHPLRRLGRRHVEREVGAELPGGPQPARQPVGGDDRARAHQARLDQVAQPERAGPQHGDARPGSAAALQPEQGHRGFHAMGHRHHLGDHRDLVRQTVGHPEDGRAGKQVEVLGPAAEQVRRTRAVQAVPVVLQVLAEVVRVVPPAVEHSARTARSRRARSGHRAAARRPTRPSPPRRSPPPPRRSRARRSAGSRCRARAGCPRTAWTRRGRCACRYRRSRTGTSS